MFHRLCLVDTVSLPRRLHASHTEAVCKQSLEPQHKRWNYQGQSTGIDSSAALWTYREWMHICPLLGIAVLFCHYQGNSKNDVLKMTLCSYWLNSHKGRRAHTHTNTHTFFCWSRSTNFKTAQFNVRVVCLAFSVVPLMQFPYTYISSHPEDMM